MSLNSIFNWFVFLFFFYFIIALYLDRVWSEDGPTQPWWFCFLPRFWCASREKVAPMAQQTDPSDADSTGNQDPDVSEEATRIKARAGQPMGPEAAVEIRGLVKTFSKRNCCKDCRLYAKSIFHAVKGPWYEIRKNELFCLLGPNGAGKTTTINMLVGNLAPTSGEALELGNSIRSPAGMMAIRQKMGVCPQFDVQWSQLTAWEHLYLFGTLKGLGAQRQLLRAEVAQRLAQVGLSKKEPWLVKTGHGQRVAAFSGGEKRRLSVAMALMGEPDLLYLDEPTTGMDPISRREVWNLIHATKNPEAHPGRAVVLTTHSMEEAEILSDRVAIMARGALRCFGTSLRLKQRYGAGFAVKVGVVSAEARSQVSEEFATLGVTSADNAEEIDMTSAHAPSSRKEDGSHAAVDNVESPEARHSDRLKAMQFTVPRGREMELTATLGRLQAMEGVSQVTMGLNSLESVFLRIARDAEIEEAQTNKQNARLKCLVEHELLVKGTAELEIEVGQERVLVTLQTSSGPQWFVCAVEWGQNEDGSITVVGTRLQLATPEDMPAAAAPPDQSAQPQQPQQQPPLPPGESPLPPLPPGGPNSAAADPRPGPTV